MRHQRRTAFDAQHLSGPGCQWQCEVAETAEPVDDMVRGLHVQQLQRTVNQHAVDLRIDLREVSRLEGHSDAELGQAVAEHRPALVQQVHGVGPLRLQPPLHLMHCGKLAQSLRIARR